MENKIDKKIDHLLQQVDKSGLAKEPSFDFTDKVMKLVNQKPVFTGTTSYTPLISKKIGILIFAAVCLGLVIVSLSNPSHSEWLPQLNYDQFSLAPVFEHLNKLQISDTLLYAMTLLGGMLLVQITWLKKSHDKKWSN